MSRKILAVDDDPDQLRAVCACLNDAGFVTSTARNGREALELARSVSPDLIVLDLMMPQLDGYSVCVSLRKDADTASIPILMLTGFSSDFARRTGTDAGASDYIVKPFNPEELVSKVEAILCERRAEVQNSPQGAALPAIKHNGKVVIEKP